MTMKGICIEIRRRGVSSSFTIRNVFHNTGFEKTFMFYSPSVLEVKKVVVHVGGDAVCLC